MIRIDNKTPFAALSAGTMNPELLGHERPDAGMGGPP